MSFFQLVSSEPINSLFEGSIFFLLVVVISLVMKAYFRAVAAWFSDPTPAQSAAGVTLLALTLYTGYNIPELSMIGALRWITYINVRVSYHVHYCCKIDLFSADEVRV